jgi:hypothetical protein
MNNPQDNDIDRARADRNKQQGHRSDLLGVDNKSRLGNRGREYWLLNWRENQAEDRNEFLKRILHPIRTTQKEPNSRTLP